MTNHKTIGLESGDIHYWATRAAELTMQRDELASMLKVCAMAMHRECGDSLLLSEARTLLARVEAK